MNKNTFEAFRKLVYEKAGIALGEKKEALVAARLSKRMHLLNIDSFEDYMETIKADNTGNEIVQLLDSISTNVTHFFRENQHFDFIVPQIDNWYSQGQRKLRIWSAGCSSGEEPYTIAMTVLEALKGRTADIKILATDLSTRILTRAMSGVYGAKDVGKIPENYLKTYFNRSIEDNQTNYQIIPQCRSIISFQRLNLLSMPYPMKGPFDLIFCRNVMIYFDNDMRKKLLEQYFKLLKTGGYLLVGHAESLTGMLSGFKSVKPSIYIKA